MKYEVGENVACMCKIKNTYKRSSENLNTREHLDALSIDDKKKLQIIWKIKWENIDWVHKIKDGNKRHDLVNIVITIRILQKVGMQNTE
jgi:hypothetical protein